MSDVNWFSLSTKGVSSNGCEVFKEALQITQGNLVLEIKLEALRGLKSLFSNLPFLEEDILNEACTTFKWQVLRKAILVRNPNESLSKATKGSGCLIAENNRVGLFLCKIKRNNSEVIEFIAYDYMKDVSLIKAVNLQTLLTI